MRWHICDWTGFSMFEFRYKKEAVDFLKKRGYVKKRGDDVYTKLGCETYYLIHG